MTPIPFLDVSRETHNRLEIFAQLLAKWNPKINLVSKGTLQDVWSRHIIDSKQVFDLVPHPVEHWVDLGSGGGFPGMVIAILAQEFNSPVRTSLVESDTRKCAFLRTVARETGVDANVVNERIEMIEPLHANVLSARALADLSQLLAYTHRHLEPNGTAVFHKGKSWGKELKTAQSKWKFNHRIATSETEADSVILSIEGVSSA